LTPFFRQPPYLQPSPSHPSDMIQPRNVPTVQPTNGYVIDAITSSIM
jgi:hypothetical protein